MNGDDTGDTIYGDDGDDTVAHPLTDGADVILGTRVCGRKSPNGSFMLHLLLLACAHFDLIYVARHESARTRIHTPT